MMNREQYSPAVYGLFFEEPYEGQVLLGLYNLEGEADAARQAYIATDAKDFADADQRHAEQKRLEEAVVVRRLPTGRVPSYYFAA